MLIYVSGVNYYFTSNHTKYVAQSLCHILRMVTVELVINSTDVYEHMRMTINSAPDFYVMGNFHRKLAFPVAPPTDGTMSSLLNESTSSLFTDG